MEGCHKTSFHFFFACKQLFGSLHLRKAITAVHRTIALRLERHSGLAAAGSASGSEELAGTTDSILASIAAGFATLGLILETALCIELLLAGRENKLIAALFAN